jgi:hypothetical protein
VAIAVTGVGTSEAPHLCLGLLSSSNRSFEPLPTPIAAPCTLKYRADHRAQPRQRTTRGHIARTLTTSVHTHYNHNHNHNHNHTPTLTSSLATAPHSHTRAHTHAHTSSRTRPPTSSPACCRTGHTPGIASRPRRACVCTWAVRRGSGASATAAASAARTSPAAAPRASS